MDESVKNINVVEIMKSIHREADDIYGRDVDEKDSNTNEKNLRTIDFRSILKHEPEEFVNALYMRVFERKADSETTNRLIEELKAGKSKDVVIREVMNSEEAKALKVNYYGLTEYSVQDFLKYDDIAFINNVYYKILMRTPDTNGAKRYLYRLQSGTFSKEEIIWIFINSDEGKKKNVVVKGLSKRKIWTRKILRHIPLYNKLFKLKMALSYAASAEDEIRELREENEKIKEELNSLKRVQQRNNLVVNRNLDKINSLINEGKE